MLTLTDSAEPPTTSYILQACFPDPVELSTVLTPGELPVHVIPQGAEPRWVILGDPRRALPVLRSWRPWNLSSRLGWSVVLTAATLKMLPELPGVRNSSALINCSYWQHKLPEFSENWTAVIHVGSRSYTRKATLFFLGEDHSFKAVAKVPLVTAAAHAILNEAAILLRLKTIENLPVVLFQDFDHGIAAQSWLEGKPVSRGFTAAHVDLLSLLANPGNATRVSDYQAEIAAKLDELDLPFDRSLLACALELLSFNEPLQEFVEHRDFAPWNLKWLPNGSLGLLDWEWAVPNGLPWQDVCRFFFLVDALFDGPGKVWETMNSNPLLQKFRQRFSIPQSALPPLTMHYLLRVLHLDWQSGNVRLAQYTFRQIQLLLDNCRGMALKS